MFKELRFTKRLIVLWILGVSSCAALLTTSLAGATSVYDETYKTTQSVSLSNVASGSTGACAAADYSTDLLSLFDQASNPYSSQRAAIANLKASYLTAKEGGGRWGVSQFQSPSGDYEGIYIYWTEDASLALSWEGFTGNYLVRPTGNDLKSISFVTQATWWGNSNCQPYVQFALSTYSPDVSRANGSVRNFFVYTDHPNYPSEYEGDQIVASTPPPRSYVALGDSFSSGEGNPPFESGTETECRRSPLAYPRLLESSSYLALVNFAACSGAVTSDIDGAGVGDQVAALSQDTDIVTLTIGGNDVDFSGYATACTVSVCDFSTQAYQNISSSISNDLPAKLAVTYEAIDDATSSSVKIYVLGYPHLAPSQMPTGPNSMCFPLNGGNNNPDPVLNNGATVYAVQTQLNNAIQEAVDEYGSAKFQYVDPNAGDSPFAGHDWCGQDRYFHQITLNNISYSYHPNIPGHQAYAALAGNIVD